MATKEQSVALAEYWRHQIAASTRSSAWEDSGFVLHYKSLEEEKFRWPRLGQEIVSLTGEQINWLLDGYDISLMKGHKNCITTRFFKATRAPA